MINQNDKSSPGVVAVKPCPTKEAMCPPHSEAAPGLDGSDDNVNSLHWFPWYPNRWLGSLSVKCMSMEERGVYRELLDWQWQGQGYLPKETKTLSSVVGFDVSKYKTVLEKFPVTDRGRANMVLLSVWNEQQAKHERRSLCSKKRWKKTETETETEGNAYALHDAKHDAKHVELTDDDFWKVMAEKFSWVDVSRERSKMEAWLLTPKGRGRHITRRFVVNWLSKIDAPMEQRRPALPQPLTPAQLEIQRKALAKRDEANVTNLPERKR